MEYADTLRFWMDVVFHPGKATKRALGVKEALKLYYSLAVIPIVLGAIVVVAVGGFNPFSPTMSVLGLGNAAASGQSASGIAIGIGYLLLMLLVVVPITVLINSGIYHMIVGKLFNIYKKDYAKVFMAMVYGLFPVLLVYWLCPFRLVGGAIIALVGIWSFIVDIIAISNQLGMSRLKAFGTLVLNGIIVGLIALVIFAVIAMFAIVSMAKTGALAGMLGSKAA